MFFPDWAFMRRNRFIGNFVGNLAALPRQDSHDGLPLALLPEEATLMVEKELAKFTEVPSLLTKPNDAIREASQAFRDELLAEQASIMMARELVTDENRQFLGR